MGRSVLCFAFEWFSTFLEWAHRDRTGLASVVHYLDNFLFAGPAGSGICGFFLHAFENLAVDLGVPLVEDKTEGPARHLMFFGI